MIVVDASLIVYINGLPTQETPSGYVQVPYSGNYQVQDSYIIFSKTLYHFNIGTISKYKVKNKPIAALESMFSY